MSFSWNPEYRNAGNDNKKWKSGLYISRDDGGNIKTLLRQFLWYFTLRFCAFLSSGLKEWSGMNKKTASFKRNIKGFQLVHRQVIQSIPSLYLKLAVEYNLWAFFSHQ